MTPIITIKYNRFLDPIFEAYIRSQKGKKDWKKPSMSLVLRNIKKYQELWAKQGDKILVGLQRTTGIVFKRNQIEVHMVSGNGRAFNSPIVMKSRYSDVDFINVLTHELIHCLYSDNRNKVNDVICDPRFDSTSNTTQNHIVLHAVLKYIYLDVLKEPKHLKADIKFCTSADYKEAWSIVEAGDYKEIIKAFKKRVAEK